jgi:hypothetical protein
MYIIIERVDRQHKNKKTMFILSPYLKYNNPLFMGYDNNTNIMIKWELGMWIVTINCGG